MVTVWYGKAQRWEIASHQSQVVKWSLYWKQLRRKMQNYVWDTFTLGLYSKEVVIRLILWPGKRDNTSKQPKKDMILARLQLGRICLYSDIIQRSKYSNGSMYYRSWEDWEKNVREIEKVSYTWGRNRGFCFRQAITIDKGRKMWTSKTQLFMYLFFCLLWECKVWG